MQLTRIDYLDVELHYSKASYSINLSNSLEIREFAIECLNPPSFTDSNFEVNLFGIEATTHYSKRHLILLACSTARTLVFATVHSIH